MTNNKVPDDILEPFRIALELEREGKQLFTEAALSTPSKLARQTFEFLAAEEDKHIEKIERFYDSLKMSGESDLPDTEDSTAEQKLETFNAKLEAMKDQFKATKSDIDAYRMALRFENGAEDFYAEKLAEATNPKIKRFYQWLIDEESMHSRLIKSCLQFVENPAEWFQRRKRL